MLFCLQEFFKFWSEVNFQIWADSYVSLGIKNWLVKKCLWNLLSDEIQITTAMEKLSSYFGLITAVNSTVTSILNRFQCDSQTEAVGSEPCTVFWKSWADKSPEKSFNRNKRRRNARSFWLLNHTNCRRFSWRNFWQKLRIKRNGVRQKCFYKIRWYVQSFLQPLFLYGIVWRRACYPIPKYQIVWNLSVSDFWCLSAVRNWNAKMARIGSPLRCSQRREWHNIFSFRLLWEHS